MPSELLPCPDPECGEPMMRFASDATWCDGCGDSWTPRRLAEQYGRRIASLERELHEARERAGLFELFDCYEVTVPDGTLWRVEGCYSDGTEAEPSAWGVCVMHMGEWQEAHAHETRAEAISALRAELALASPEDQGNGE